MKVYTSNILLTLLKTIMRPANFAFHLEDTYRQITLPPAKSQKRFEDTYHYPGKFDFSIRGYLPHFYNIL
jgi:hypothetical protein